MDTNIQSIMEQFQLLRADMETSRVKTVTEIKDLINTVDQKIVNIDQRVSAQEREQRKRNLIVFGIKEDHDLQPEELEELMCEIITVKLGVQVTVSDIDVIRRIGKPLSNKPRPVLLGLISFNLKLKVLKNAYKLKGVNIFIAEDYPKEVIATRKLLYPKMIEARREGRFAVIKYDKLIIKDKTTLVSNEDRKKRPLSVSPQEDKTVKDQIVNKKNKTESRDKIKGILQQYGFSKEATARKTAEVQKKTSEGGCSKRT